MKSKRFYNVMFPLWILVMLPWPALATLILVIGNSIIDFCVVFFGMKRQNLSLNKKTLAWTWLKVFVLGWTCDFVGALGLLFLSISLPNDICAAIQFNAFSNPFALLIVIAATFGVAGLLYFTNLKISFRQLEWSIQSKRRMALYLAIWTAPYLFIFPSIWLYSLG